MSENEIFSIYLSKSQIVNIVPMIGDWNAKVGSQETPGVTGKKLALEYRMKQGKS